MKRSKSQTLANVFGVLGYIALAFQWLWTAALIVPWLLRQDILVGTLQPSAMAPSPSGTTVSPIIAALLIGFSVIIVAVSLFFAFKVPKKFVKTTSHVTERTAERAVEASIRHRHQPVTQAQRRLLTRRVVLLIKLSAVFLATGLIVWAVRYLPIGLPGGLALAIGIVLSSWPLVWFGLQYLVVRASNHHLIKIL